jgi:hypothetical protein
MNFQKFRTQLDELSQFFAYIEQRFTAEELSRLDRETLMGYVRDLYKSFFAAENTPPLRPQLPLQELPKVDTEPKKIVEKVAQKIELEIEENPIEEMPVVETPVIQKPVVETPIVDTPIMEQTLAFVMPTIQDAPIEETPIKEETPIIVEPIVKETPIAEANPIAEAIETVEAIEEESNDVIAQNQERGMVILQQNQLVDTTPLRPEIVLNTVSDDQMFERSEVHFNPEYNDLFYIKDSKELSQKLADSRIEDLHKAMGLNDKFLYINELFGGNAARFKLAVDYFNQEAKTLNEARAYIERDLIEAFKWNSPLKSSLSKNFIKLLRRRYQK